MVSEKKYAEDRYGLLIMSSFFVWCDSGLPYGDKWHVIQTGVFGTAWVGGGSWGRRGCRL
jgi:hypothetical protein